MKAGPLIILRTVAALLAGGACGAGSKYFFYPGADIPTARPTELARDGDDAAATSGAAMPAGASAELAADPPFVSASFEASPKAFHAAAMVPATLSIIIISAQ